MAGPSSISFCPRKEQKGFGKFEKLKAYAEAIQEKWDLPKIKQYVLLGPSMFFSQRSECC